MSVTVAPLAPALVRRAPVLLTSVLRWTLWRTAFALVGGLSVRGRLPRGGCVVVANHSSHADAPALLAALGPQAGTRVAAAADYWFGRGGRAAVCRAVVGGFAVRRGGGGSADLAGAVELLRAGRTVVVFPEGTRSRDGSMGEFHRGAFRLAAAAGVPVVPVGIAGTRTLLPVAGSPKRSAVAVRIGRPLWSATPLEAQRAVAALAAAPAGAVESRAYSAVRTFARSPRAMLLVAAWAFAEAVSWPLVPELLLAVLVVAAPRSAPRLAALAVAASVAGGLLTTSLASAGVHPPAPLTTPRMEAVAADRVAEDGARALLAQPLSGVPYKVYATAATDVPAGDFVVWSLAARGGRIAVVAAVFALLGVVGRRWRRFYPAYLLVLVAGFAAGLSRVVSSWS